MIISAHRESTESWRVDRLEKFNRVFCHVYGISPEQLDLMIRSVYDCKGRLTVEWFFEPTERQKQAADSSWEICGEGDIEHIVSKRTLIVDEAF